MSIIINISVLVFFRREKMSRNGDGKSEGRKGKRTKNKETEV